MTGIAPAMIVIAPTAYKGTLGPSEVASAFAEGVRRVWPAAEIVSLPLSDGGTGLLESYRPLGDSTIETVEVAGPLGDTVTARVLWEGELAVIESAEACGIHLVPPERRDPLAATTRGVGQLVRAVHGRARKVVLGLGGSGTVDGGTGMAREFGWRFIDAAGRPLPEGGGSLADLHRIVPPNEPCALPVVALCDVGNTLTGPRGAARVYGPQKGADPQAVERLEAGLARLARAIAGQLDLEVEDLPGSGAAGGLGAGARAFLGAELVSGADWMMERAALGQLLTRAGLLVTGEGRFDVQSAMGKLTGRVLEAARAAGVPALLACGHLEGKPPAGVHVAAGSGQLMDAGDLTALVESACRGLA